MDKKKKINNITPLEVCILEKPIMLRWISYLVDTFAINILNFWLETQNFKYIDDQQTIEQEAHILYNKYFSDKAAGINIDDQGLIIDLNKRMVVPQKTTFISIQNSIWDLLKHDLYIRFQMSSSFKTKIDKKQIKLIALKNQYTVGIYIKFLNNNAMRPTGDKFEPQILPQKYINNPYKEHLHIAQINVLDIWKDGDLFLAFREFLYQQYADECLSFYMTARCYELLSKNERIKQSKEIYGSYISSAAKSQINIDDRMKQAITKTYLSGNKTVYQLAKQHIWNIIERSLFPDFLKSPLYADCNKDTIKYIYTGRMEKSDTLSRYTVIHKRPINNPYNITQKQLYQLN
jgi:hypothetical protein